jgi:hypothetical protein
MSTITITDIPEQIASKFASKSRVSWSTFYKEIEKEEEFDYEAIKSQYEIADSDFKK